MPKNLTKNHFPNIDRLVVAGRWYKADMVADMTLFRPRKQGNSKAQKTFRGKFQKNSILSTFRFFSLLRSDVLLILRYIK